MSENDQPAPPPKTTGGSWRWEPPKPEELQLLLPQYEIHALVGRGGMGAVYKGTQLSLDRPVAIKLLPPAIEQQDSAFAERFKNEAKLMGRMNHPAIVSVYDFGRTTDGQLYFVMEYIDGTDVQRMIAREGRLPPEHALAVTAHLCDALGYAHKHGVVHRDIKPSNVLIDMDGRVKVADFGLAKLTNSAQNSGLTQTGMAMGTPDYVAPETLTLGVEVDGRADLYAVGVMLYQMLTGDIPRGMFKMPSQKIPSIDPRFDGIVRRALEHDREERYQSSLEIRRDLDVILTTPLATPGQSSSAALPKQAAAAQPAAQASSNGRTVVPSSRNPASAPQHRAGPQFEPPVQAPARSESSSTLPYVIAALVMLAAGGWYITHPQAAHETDEVTEPVTPPPNPFETPGTAPTPPVRPLSVTPPKPPPPVGTPPKTVTPAPTPPVKPPPSSVSIADRLADMESQFQNDFEREVNTSYSDLITTLGVNYVAAIDRAITEADRARRSAESAALNEEKQRFTTHKFMPSIDPASLHSSVVKLRSTYRGAEKSYAVEKDRKSLPLYDKYIKDLETLTSQLDSQGRVADASRVRIKRDDVLARRKQRAAKLPAGASVPPPTAPARSRLTLFDGQSLNGWRIVGDADSFTVISGEIRSNRRPGNLIYVGTGGSTPVWKDFTLDLKFKCEDRSNSGVWLHIPDPTTLINRKVTGFEVNIDNGKETGTIWGAVDISSGKVLSGTLGNGFFGSKATPDLQPGRLAWLSMRITAKSGLVTVWLDGDQINQWSLPAGWTPPPATNYVQTFQGTIGLQSLNGSVAFKDITVELL